jgi:pimeloyl-ACP methyl ester carboxylesterase
MGIANPAIPIEAVKAKYSMNTSNQPQSISLKDGRTLSYYEFGDPAGKAVFYFPGATASGLIGRNIHAAALQTGARIIAPNRPGIGQSGYQPGRRLLDWPADVCQLADTLGIGRFAVMSESGGSPYAAACARMIPDRLTGAAIVSGACPFDASGVMDGLSAQGRASYQMMKYPLWLLRLAFLPLAAIARINPAALRAQLLQAARAMPEVDQTAFSEPEYLQAVLGAYCDAFQQGARGPALDLKLCAGSWGGWLPEISVEVRLWHGTLDTSAPVAMAEYMKKTLPKCRANFLPGEGHVSLMHNHGREILESVTK